MANAINTRLVLRNDHLSAWEKSKKDLLQGELALARLSGELSDKYEIRIGVGDKTWNELSGSNFIIPAENVAGLTSTIASLSTSFYEEATYDALTAHTDVTNGSIGVVKEAITSNDGTVSTYVRTGYVYDSESGTWQQLNGNYRADQVYFTDNMKLTEQFGKYAANKTGYTLSCKNKSLTDVLTDAYAETKQPAITQPVFDFALNTTTLTGEVGATYTLPTTATFTFTNDGNYEFGPDTGITTDASISAEAKACMASTSKTGMVEGNTLTATANATSAYVEGVVTYNYTATYSSTAGAQPKDNVGGTSTKSPIAAQTNKTKTATFTATGYLPAFYVFTSTLGSAPTSISASTDKDNNGLTYTSLLNDYTKTKFSSAGSWYQLFYVVPKTKNTKTSWSGIDDNTKLPVNPEACTDCTITLLNGTTVDAKVFIVQNSKAAAKTSITMTYA